jgi:hypothetical protein
MIATVSQAQTNHSTFHQQNMHSMLQPPAANTLHATASICGPCLLKTHHSVQQQQQQQLAVAHQLCIVTTALSTMLLRICLLQAGSCLVSKRHPLLAGSVATKQNLPAAACSTLALPATPPQLTPYRLRPNPYCNTPIAFMQCATSSACMNNCSATHKRACCRQVVLGQLASAEPRPG